MVEIVDEKSARAWLEEQDHQTQVWFACRCALRAAPALSFEPEETFDHLALMAFRAMLISGAASTCLALEVSVIQLSAHAAADAAAHAADSTAHAATHSAARAAALSAALSTARSAARSAALSALSAADAADHSAAHAAAYDASAADAALVRTWPRLWHEKDSPTGLSEALAALKRRFQKAQNIWSFWQEWYEAILNGTPLPWELSFRIVTELSDEDWEAGPAHVAARINEVRADWEAGWRPESVPELEKSKLLQHLNTLLQNPEMTALSAEGAAEVLERAIRDFLDAGVANRLPDELEHLEALPPIFRRIATLVKSAGTASAKEEKLAAEIERLNAKVAALEADLKAARAKCVDGVFKAAYLRALGASMGAATVGSVALGVSHFFGVAPSDITLENLRGWLDMLMQAEPLPDGAPPALPPLQEI